MRLNTIKGIVQNYFERCFDFYPDSVGYIDVSDKWMLVTLCWRQFLGVIERISILVTIFWILVFDDNTVTNTSNLSSIHFVSNIRHQYRCSQLKVIIMKKTNLHDDDFDSVSVRLIYDFSNRIWSIVFQMHRDKLCIKNNFSFHHQWKPY